MAQTGDRAPNYAQLLQELPRIAKVVNAFSSDAVQQSVFSLLVTRMEEARHSVSAGDGESAGAGAKRVRKTVKGRGSGTPRASSKSSARARVETLVGDGYFSKPRATSEVTAELGRRGHHYQSRKIAMALLELVRKGRIRRQGARGSYQYVNA